MECVTDTSCTLIERLCTRPAPADWASDDIPFLAMPLLDAGPGLLALKQQPALVNLSLACPKFIDGTVENSASLWH